MQDQFSESKSTKKKIIRRVWFWIFIGLVIVGVLFFIMLPVGIDYGIERYLKDQGADRATLEDVDFNPLTGRMTLTSLNVQIGAQTVLNIPEATFLIKWTPFIRKRFVLERFTLSNTQLTVKELDDGRWQVGGIILPEKNETSEPSSWNFGLEQVTVKNSEIRLISSFLTSDLKIELAQLSNLSSWMPEGNARLELKGQFNDGKLEFQGDIAPLGDEIKAAGQFKLKDLALAPFAQLLKPHLKTLEGRLDIDLNFETRQTPDSGFSHHQKGLLNLSQIRTQIGDSDFSNENLVWDGAVRIDMPKSEGLKIAANGKLDGLEMAMVSNNEDLQIKQKDLKWKGTVNYEQTSANTNLNIEGALRLQNTELNTPDIKLAEEKLTWNGTFQFSSTAETDGQRIIADGTLDGGHLLMNLLDQKLNFEHADLAWKGRLDSGATNDLNSLSAEGDFRLKNVQIHYPQTNVNLLNSDGVALKAIKVKGIDNVRVSDVTFSGLNLVTPVNAEKSSSALKPLFSTQKVTIQNIQLTKSKDLSIAAVKLKDLTVSLHRNNEGQLSAINRLETIRTDLFSSDQKKQPTDFGFRIGQLEITGDNLVRFEDESVSPTFSIDLKILEAHLSNLDTSRPEQPASVKLLVSDGENARLSLDGSIQPFGERLNLDWVGKIESLELPPLSPYVIQSTGYSFTSGEMQADMPVKISQNQLDGKIDLILYNPTVERVKAEDPEKEKKGKIQLTMPLDSALKLLRDKQNNVKLKIPISGDISHPEFSVADAINRVLAKTFQKSALSYLKFMLGPYGIGIAAAEQLVGDSSIIRLNPIPFAPGNAELDEAAIDYLERVAAILKEHPAAQLVVCGVATESDRGALSESPSTEAGAQPRAQKENNLDKENTTDTGLLELAKNRTERIKGQLVKSHGIAAKRIVACKPKIDKDAGAKPRADLEI